MAGRCQEGPCIDRGRKTLADAKSAWPTRQRQCDNHRMDTEARWCTWSYRPNVISVRRLAGLGEMLPVARPIEHRRLPLHGLSPRRSFPHLVLISYELSIWYDGFLIEITGTKHTGLSPDKITPMLGVHETERRWCVGFEWLVNSRRSHIAAVRRMKTRCCLPPQRPYCHASVRSTFNTRLELS